MRALILAFLVTLLGACAPRTPPAPTPPIYSSERADHRLTQIEPLRVRRCVRGDEDWRLSDALDVVVEVAADGGAEFISVKPTPITVSTREQDVPAISPTCVAAVRAAVRTWRYRPFERDGRLIAVRLTETIVVYPPESRLTQRVSFPKVRNVETARITLERGACLGTCPVYRVELRGDGTVIYNGRGFVLVSGEHRYAVDAAQVTQLLSEFRAAEFFSLLDRYEAGITDLAGTKVTIEIDGRRKSVYDYVGLSVGMPTSVWRLERSIERVAGSDRLVRGNSETIPFLVRQGFDFRSAAGAQMMRVASHISPDRVVLDLLEAGAPLVQSPSLEERGYERFGWGAEPVANVARRGRIAVVRAFLARGHFARLSAAQRADVLRAAAFSGNVELVREILQSLTRLPGGVRERDASMALFATAWPPFYTRSRDDQDYRRNVAQTVQLLCEAGADPNIRDDSPDSPRGFTLLHMADDTDTARALIACGADLEARNDNGETPLLIAPTEDVALALMAAGADTRATADGRSFPVLARQRRWSHVQRMLAQPSK